MADLEQVTYCGLYCGLCAQRNRIPQRADALRDAMHKEGWDFWGVDIPDFKQFWSFLNDIADSESRSACRGGKCGRPDCPIRICARQKNIEVCVFCESYPCDNILNLARSYINLLADARHMKEIGIEAWIQEQEERKKTGFAYADIRVRPSRPPDDSSE